jgi:hypothetical protein
MTEQKQAAEAPAPYAETPADPVTAEQRREEQAKEYGTWVALGPIDHDGARAYNTGDPVPAENVKRWKYDERGLVGRRSTKAAQAVDAALKSTVGSDVQDDVAAALLTRQFGE